jgi:KUP system potassium uptake protein
VTASAVPAPRMSRMPAALVVAAMGVVFGDIGTSPLYTLKTCFDLVGAKPDLPSVLGICSLLFWALTLVVCVKYVGFILRVNHDGEGGILALLALASPTPAFGALIRASVLTIVVIVGGSMLLGDGIITPAISVISAVEGISVVSSAFQPFVVPIALLVIIGLFTLQRAGTEGVGRLFGPVMLLWFVVIAGLGLIPVLAHPEILQALNPLHALAFLTGHGLAGFTILGGVVLAITGVEALYADLSHFGYRPIATGWYAIVFPALVLNYLGQGAKVLANPHAMANPFYALAPAWALLPMVVLATIATVIASQALISGTFTLVEQAIALNLAPRVLVRHTSHRYKGQVYVPSINRWLAIGCAVLVVVFQSSAHLAAAYGLAVAFTMLCTSIAFYVVITDVLRWPKRFALPLVVCFALIDGSFVLASLPKFVDGGYIPLTISAVLVLISLTWLEGRRKLTRELATQQTPVDEVIDKLPSGVGSSNGTMVFLTPDPRGVPFLARHRWVRDRVLEERIVLLNIARAATPYLENQERVFVERLSLRLIRVTARFGYMETPRIDPILKACGAFGLELDRDDTSFFYADPKIEPAANGKGMPGWRRELFVTLQRNARPLPDDLRIRAERRVELGVTVEL